MGPFAGLEGPASEAWSEVVSVVDRCEESDLARTERGLAVVAGGSIADVGRARDGGRREAMAGEDKRWWTGRVVAETRSRRQRIQPRASRTSRGRSVGKQALMT